MPFETELVLKAILDYSPENIVLMDRDHKVICFNESISQTLFAYHKKYIEIGDDYRDFVVEMAMPTYLDAFAKALQGEITQVELETVSPHFKLCFHYRVNPVYLPNGDLLGVCLSAEDITERKNAEKELAESEAKFRTLVESSVIGVFILDEDNFVYLNPAFSSMIGFSSDIPLSTYKLSDFLHPDSIQPISESSARVTSQSKDTEYLVITIVRSDGEVRLLETTISRIWYNGQVALLGSSLDITDRIDEEIRINEAVDRTQELERTQIGMELHDNVKQQIAATVLYLQFCAESCQMDDEAQNIIKKSAGFLKQAVGDLRQLSHRLAPAVDSDANLLEKVTTLIDRMNPKQDIRVRINIASNLGKPDAERQLVIYRIIQEQFGNIVNHSKASNVAIGIVRERNNIIISITDDGVGFEISGKPNGIGLQNIRRRLQVLGGTFKLASSPGAGCRLVASLPDQAAINL